MNPLPQRKKSAEEIAKLRETMGIPAAPTMGEEIALPELHAEEALPVENVVEPTGIERISMPPPPAWIPLPQQLASLGAARAVHSLRRSERRVIDQAGEKVIEPAPLPIPIAPRMVKSLRKSEQVPVNPVRHHPLPAETTLPTQRHSERELSDIQRQGAIQLQAATNDPRTKIAHLALVIPGYFMCLIPPIGIYYYALPLLYTALAVLCVSSITGYIFIKKPLSRHHAAFLAVMVIFTLIFSSLYYFPQLRYGT